MYIQYRVKWVQIDMHTMYVRVHSVYMHVLYVHLYVCMCPCVLTLNAFNEWFVPSLL